MPTILNVEGFRFFCWSGDRGEPRHVHVERGDGLAKYWLDPVSLVSSKRFTAHELRKIGRLVLKYQDDLRKGWDEHFGP